MKIAADYKMAKKVENEEVKMLTDMEFQASDDGGHGDLSSSDEEEPKSKKLNTEDEIALMLKEIPGAPKQTPPPVMINTHFQSQNQEIMLKAASGALKQPLPPVMINTHLQSQNQRDSNNDFSKLVAKYAMQNHEEEVSIEPGTFTIPTGNQIVNQTIQVPGTSSGITHNNGLGMHRFQYGKFINVPEGQQNNSNVIYSIVNGPDSQNVSHYGLTEQLDDIVEPDGYNNSSHREFAFDNTEEIAPQNESSAIDDILDSLLNDENMKTHFEQFPYKENHTIPVTPTVDQRLIHLTKLVGVLAYKLVSVEKKLDNMQALMIAPTQESVEFLESNELPVKTIEDMGVLEKKIENPSFRVELVR